MPPGRPRSIERVLARKEQLEVILKKKVPAWQAEYKKVCREYSELSGPQYREQRKAALTRKAKQAAKLAQSLGISLADLLSMASPDPDATDASPDPDVSPDDDTDASPDDDTGVSSDDE